MLNEDKKRNCIFFGKNFEPEPKRVGVDCEVVIAN